MDKVKLAKEIKRHFDQDEDDIPEVIGYYSGIDGFVVQEISHIDHLWTILDRIQSEIMMNDNVKKKQEPLFMHFIDKWMKEIEPYCVRLESE